MDALKNLRKMIKKDIREGKKREKRIKKFKKYNFPEGMIKDLDEYFNRHHGLIEFYIDSPWLGNGLKGTEFYQIFRKYGREKDLRHKIDFPIIWNLKEGTHHLDLGDWNIVSYYFSQRYLLSL